ncbi:ABC transporter permease subunit [Candidatus Saccharibacteria bacterium]|jgi:ABC-2 type transport system permease protein|nr:ABC transporter permease subunit [Candidatus Saccharibacteria bacterium]MBP9131607.1 ABC transporter permease subunit [Candidatus Saccharibacteria bacterium]
MSRIIFGKAIWDRKISIAVTCLVMFIFALMFAALHVDSASKITLLADSYPEALSAVFGDIAAGASPEGFLNLELYSLFLPFTLAITGIVFAVNAIGKEEESGTLELLLASPISRSKIIIEKLTAIKLTLLVISFSAWIGVLVGKHLFVFDANLAQVALASLSVYLLGLTYAMVAFAGQSITGKRSAGIGLGAGLLTLTYFADIVSKLVDNLDNLKYVSPFYYMDMEKVINGNGKLINFVIMIGLSVVFYMIAHIAFINRDTGI